MYVQHKSVTCCLHLPPAAAAQTGSSTYTSLVDVLEPWGNSPVPIAAQPQLVLLYMFLSPPACTRLALLMAQPQLVLLYMFLCFARVSAQNTKTCITTCGRRRRPTCTWVLPQRA